MDLDPISFIGILINLSLFSDLFSSVRFVCVIVAGPS